MDHQDDEPGPPYPSEGRLSAPRKASISAQVNSDISDFLNTASTVTRKSDEKLDDDDESISGGSPTLPKHSIHSGAGNSPARPRRSPPASPAVRFQFENEAMEHSPEVKKRDSKVRFGDTCSDDSDDSGREVSVKFKPARKLTSSPKPHRASFTDSPDTNPKHKTALKKPTISFDVTASRFDRIPPRRRGSDGEVDIKKSQHTDNENNNESKGLNGFGPRKISWVEEADAPDSSPIPRSRIYLDHTPHDMFVELNQLTRTLDHGWVWQEKARWIKFEEDVEKGAERWGKPHVASLSFHSLLEMRKCLGQGAVLLDLDAYDFPSVVTKIVENFVDLGSLEPEHQGQVLKTLLLNHKHIGDKHYTHKESQLPNVSTFASAARRRQSTPHLIMTMKDDDDDDDSISDRTIISRRASDPESNAGVHQTKSFKQTIQDLKNQAGISDDEEEDETVIEPPPLPEFVLPTGRRKSVAAELLQGLAQKVTETENPILKRIPEDSEGAAILVGAVDFLEEPIMAFVRLSLGQFFDNILEISIPIRFVILVLGPKDKKMELFQIGRSISTLMANTEFRATAYASTEKQGLLDAINEFLDDSIVLPPGKLDEKTLLPIMDMAMKKTAEKTKKEREEMESSKPPDKFGDPLKRTKRMFGGLVNDVRRRYPVYLSDFKDALNLQALGAFFFIYFACLAPAITFGGLLGDATDRLIGVSEMLVATCVGGIVMALLAGQPLVLIGLTGPVLVYEEALFQICRSVGLDYLSFRVWIGFWMTIIGLVYTMVEGSFMVRYVTRFLQEIFASLTSLIFIYEVFRKLYLVFRRHPLLPYYPECPANTTGEMFNSTISNGTIAPAEVNDTVPSDMPNTALFSLILTFGTFIIANVLKNFKTGRFFSRRVRSSIGDFGIPIAIVIMVLVDYLVQDTFTPKLDVPASGFTPTDPERRGWFINPLGAEKPLPVWAFFVALLPALLLSILMFMEVLMSSMIVDKKEHNLKKGTGYHLDIFLMSILASVCGILGLPIISIAVVRCVAHVSSLSVFSRTHAPGEKPKLVKILEQRVTALAAHVLIGVSVLLGPVLRQVPLAVLFGVFLFMGVAALNGIQFIERVELYFMPVKHHPNVGFVRRVRTWKMHLYTFIQLLCLAVLWAVKSTQAALAFPFILLLLVPVRLKLLKYIFKPNELFHLDRAGAGNDFDDDEPAAEEKAKL